MILRVLITLIPLIALVSAGGKTLSPAESREVLQLFRRFCGSGSSGSEEGKTRYYCKLPDNGPFRLDINHDAEIDGGETPKQVIFVQPPAYNYVHNVAVKGSPGSPQQTDIYVLPPTASHNLNLRDQREHRQQHKPSLFFLTNSEQQPSQQVRPPPGIKVPPPEIDPNRQPLPPPKPNHPLVAVGNPGYLYPPPQIDIRMLRHAPNPPQLQLNVAPAPPQFQGNFPRTYSTL